MATLDRTAYPRWPRTITAALLQQHYTPTADEHTLIRGATRNAAGQLNFALLLKAVQHLHYFPVLEDIPLPIVRHLRTVLQLPSSTAPGVGQCQRSRYYARIRAELQLVADGQVVRHHAVAAVVAAATTMDHPADLLNVAVATLMAQRCELPAFDTLDRLVRRVRALINARLFAAVAAQLTPDQQTQLDALLIPNSTLGRTPYNGLKRGASTPTRDHLADLLTHLEWLDTLGDYAPALHELTVVKRQHLAATALALDAHELRATATPRRLALLACAVQRVQATTRDAAVDMFRARVRRMHHAAREALLALQQAQQAEVHRLLTTFGEVLTVFEAATPHTDTVAEVRALLDAAGGTAKLQEACDSTRAVASDNYLPLIWRHYRSHRSVFFRMLDLLHITTTSQDTRLIHAIAWLKANHTTKAREVSATLDLSFASAQWQRTIVQRKNKQTVHQRQHLEVCIWSYLAQELYTGDLAVTGADAYHSIHDQLLPWAECQTQLAAYCADVGLPTTADAFVQQLQQELSARAAEVDAGFPKNTELTITADGEPKLKRAPRRVPPPTAAAIETLITVRMPQRTVIDMLDTVARWTDCVRHFGPRSGNEAKLHDPLDRYVRLLFAYGTNLGPTQAALHMCGVISAHSLGYLNRRHVSAATLHAAQADIINLYDRLPLTRRWGSGSSAAADGTKVEVAEGNPLAEYHIRYGGMGVLAYRHVADTYIALFCQLIRCGVWEAVYLIDGLLGNQSDVQPKAVHTDTQGQSTPVFALTYLLGIELLPRIRNWKDLVFYKADGRFVNSGAK